VCFSYMVNVLFFIKKVQSHLQHYTESSTDPLPTSNTALSNTLLPLGQGTLTHNSAGVPIIVACTKADLIDEGNDMVAGASGMGSMVKGKGGEWEERTDGIMQVLRTICLKCKVLFVFLTRQFVLHTEQEACFKKRRRCVVLYDSSSCNFAGAATIRFAYAVYAPGSLARYGSFHRHSRSCAQDIPFHP